MVCGSLHDKSMGRGTQELVTECSQRLRRGTHTRILSANALITPQRKPHRNTTAHIAGIAPARPPHLTTARQNHQTYGISPCAPYRSLEGPRRTPLHMWGVHPSFAKPYTLEPKPENFMHLYNPFVCWLTVPCTFLPENDTLRAPCLQHSSLRFLANILEGIHFFRNPQTPGRI